MKEKRPSSGKIELHGNGMGVPSPEDIERRAREIAMIDERNPDEFTDVDWSHAREELMGSENNEPINSSRAWLQSTSVNSSGLRSSIIAISRARRSMSSGEGTPIPLP